ncbi:hypothetical protein LINPERHAP1_LOCUS15352 [Linum perenne]
MPGKEIKIEKRKLAGLFIGPREAARDVVAWSISWSILIQAALERDRKFLGTTTTIVEVNVAWDPSPEGWISLNSDGLVDRDRRQETAGGLLRDHTGGCLLAYSMNLRCCSITSADM